MLALILVALTLVPAWSLAQEDQGLPLAQLARAERQRKAANPNPPVIITNANLRDFKGFVSSAGQSVGTVDDAEAGSEDAGGGPEWQSGLSEARLNLEQAENRGRVLQLKMTDLRNEWLSSSDGTTQGRRRQQLEETRQQLEANQREVQAAREALRRHQREAKTQGATPGDLRRSRN